MALTRVQATPKATVASQTSITFTFATPPTVGNGIVVIVNSWSAAFPVNGCTDNRGNVYKQAITRQNSKSTAIYYCEKVTASAAPFSVTVTGASSWYVGLAIEVGGLGGYPLGHTSISGSGTSTAPNSGTTAALPKDEVFLAAGVAIASGQSSITVAVVSPTWTQEFEELSTSFCPGEGDTRIVTGVAGATTSASWTSTGSAQWAAVLSAFWQDNGLKVSVAETISVTESPTVRSGRLIVRVSDAIQTWDRSTPPTPSPWTLIGAFVGAPGRAGGTFPPVGAGWNTTGADLLVVSVSQYWGNSGYIGYAPVGGVTDNYGNSWIPLTGRRAIGSDPEPVHRFFYAKNAIGGSEHRFTINTGGSELYPRVIVYAFAGSHLTEPLDTEFGASTFTSLDTSLAPGSVTPWSDGALILTALTPLTPWSTSGFITAGIAVSPSMTLTLAPSVSASAVQSAGAWMTQAQSAPVTPTWSWTTGTAAVANVAVFRAANTQGVEPDRQMVRVQTTPRNRSIPLTLTFPKPPVVGNAIVVYAATYIESNPFTQAAARDNYGNYYRLAVFKHAVAPVVAIYYCEQIQKTGSPFIVTLTHTAGYGENLGAAVEVAGVGGGLVLNQTGVNTSMVGNKLTAGPTPPITVDEVFIAATMNHYTDAGTDRYINVIRPPWTQEFSELGTGEGDTRGAVRATGTTQFAQWTIVGESSSWPVGALAAFGRTTNLRVAVYESVTVVEKAASSPMSIKAIERVFVDEVTQPPVRTLRVRQRITYVTPGIYQQNSYEPTVTIELPTYPLVGNGLVVIVSARHYNQSLTTLTITDNLKNEYQLVRAAGANSMGAAIGYATVRATGSAYLVTLTMPSNTQGYWAVTVVEVENTRQIGITVDKSVFATGTGTAIASGSTPALGADEVFLVAAMATSAAPSSLTVQAADPRWRQEHETLYVTGYSGGSELAGEGNSSFISRVGARGTTQSVGWTASHSGNWAAVLVAFTGQTMQVVVSETITTRDSWRAVRTPLMRAVFDTVHAGEFIGDPQRLLYRENGTFNKVESDNQGEHGFIVLNPPPTVGNGLAILVSVEWSSDEGPLTCTDTYGNTYKWEADQFDSGHRIRAAVFSTQVLASGPGFTITVAGFEDEDWWPYWTLSAVEISNPAGRGISRDGAAMATGTSVVGVASVSLPALTSAETLLVAVCAYRSNQSSITVNAVPPTEPSWVQEHEDLTGTYCIGEGDSRIVRAQGSPQTVTWTGTSNSIWAAVLVAFQGVNLNASAAETVVVSDGRTPLLYPYPLTRMVWETITRSDAVTVKKGGMEGVDPIAVKEAVSLFFGNPSRLDVRVGEYITTRELTPKEPPSPPPPQVQTFPLGYEMKGPYGPPATDILQYAGPWPTGDWTASFWSQHHGQWRLFRDGNNYGVWLLGLRQSPPTSNITLSLHTYDGTTTGYKDLVPHDLAWHHFAVVLSGGIMRVFVDGTQRNTDLTLPGPLPPTVDEQFGPYQAPYMTGPHRVAYYRMWNAALTPADLAQERQARTAVRTTNLWRDTPLEGSLLDVSGQGRHWGIGGGTVAIVGPSPLPWVAEALTVQDVAAVTVQAAHERHRVELVGVTDSVLARGQIDWRLAESVRVGETAAAAPPDTSSLIRTYRLYTTSLTATFQPVGVGRWPKGGWHHIYGEEPYLQYANALRLTHRFRVTTPTGGSNYGYFYSAVVGETFFLHSFVSDPLPAQLIAGAFNLCQLVGDQQNYSYPPRQGPRLNFKLYMYVSVGSTDAVRGVLLDYVGPDSHLWPHFYTNGIDVSMTRWWSLQGDATLTPLVIQPGDRIILAFGYVTHRAITTHSFGQNFLYSGYPIDAVPLNTYPVADFEPPPPIRNSWVEFKRGLLTYTGEVVASEPVHLADNVVQRIQLLTIYVSEAISVQHSLLFPIHDFETVQTITVTDGIVRRFFDPPLLRAASDSVTVTDAVEVALVVPPPEPPPPLFVTVFETIRTREDWLRDVDTSKLVVTAYEYVFVAETRQMAALPVVWDGGGTPPPPVTTGLVDYWKVGI